MEDPESFHLAYSFLGNLATMSPNDWGVVAGLLLGMLCLLVCSAFISATEIAFFSLDNQGLANIKEVDEGKWKSIETLLSRPDKLLATILIVNNTVNIALVLLSTIVVDKVAGAFDLSEGLLFFVQVVLITALILLFGEIIPKVYATQKTERLAKLMVKPMSVANKVFSVFSFLLVGLSRVFDRKIKVEKKSLSVDELSEVHEIVQGKTSKQELKMLDGILEIGQTYVKQIMKPRTEMTALSVQISYREVRTMILQSGFSRIPVYEGTVDKIKGVLYIKDLLPFLNDESDDKDWQSLIREPFFVPESKKLDDLLEEFQEKKIHLAVVIDEYGGTSGIVTLEDIIEEIVGDIKDEFDDDDLEYSVLGDGKYILDGKIPLLDLYRILDVEGEDFEELKGDAETVAGLLLEMKGGFPKKGEVINLEGYQFTIESVDKKRIQRVKLEVQS